MSNPQYAKDRTELTALMQQQSPGRQPTNEDLTTVGWLTSRYDQETPHTDIRTDIDVLLQLWELDISQLYQKTRAIWASGWRPGGIEAEITVGSGAS